MGYIAGVMFLLLLVVGGAGGWYYNDSQARMATLRENNARLEVAVETAEQSMNTMKEEMARNQELMNELSAKLQKAEKYGDDLRNKLRQLDLVQKAIKDPNELQGKMNGATAKLWRSIVEDTGGTPDPNLPEWLQPEPVQSATGTGSQGSDQSGENSNPDSVQAEASPVN